MEGVKARISRGSVSVVPIPPSENLAMRTLARFIPAAVLATLLTPMRLEAQCIVGAGLTTYNGSGVNPVGFSGNWALVGSVWNSTVAAGPDSMGSLIFASCGPMDPLWPGGIPRAGEGFGRGELLCQPPIVQLSFSTSIRHEVWIPSNPSLIGRTFCAQAAVLRANGKDPADVSLELQNAMILTIGYYDPFCCPNATCGG